MIRTIFFMSIESRVKAEKAKPASFIRQKQVIGEKGNVTYVDFSPQTKAPYEQKTTYKDEYGRIVEAPTKPMEEGLAAVDRPSLSTRVRRAMKNVGSMANNAVDIVIGSPLAKYYNWGTERSLKKDPSPKNQIFYSLHGVKQGRKNQWRLARQAKKEGYLPYLLQADQDKGPEYTTEQAFNQIGSLHKKTGIKGAQFRRDIYMGHSSGANTGLYMATDKRIKDYGIKQVHAVAATPHAVAMDTIGKKLLGLAVDIDFDRKDKAKGQKAAADLYKRGTPYVDVYMVGGKADGLVRPKDIAYTHAKGVHIINHDESTHFGTSGANDLMNKILLQLVKSPDKLYKSPQEYYKRGHSHEEHREAA